jgi:hypothetical protein
MWDGTTFTVNTACTVVTFTPYNTTCLCTSASSSTSSSDASGGSTAKSDLMELATSAKIVINSIARNFVSARDLNLSTIKKNLVIFITISVVVFMTFAGLLNFLRVDFKEKKVFSKETKHVKHRHLTMTKFFNSFVPDEFSGRPWYLRLWTKMLREHDWICILATYDPEHDFRSVRWVS